MLLKGVYQIIPSVAITWLRETNSIEVEVEGNFKIKVTVMCLKPRKIHVFMIMGSHKGIALLI